MKAIQKTPEKLLLDKTSLAPVVKKVVFDKKSPGKITGAIHTDAMRKFELKVLENAYPKTVAGIINETRESPPGVYTIIVAPYVSPSAAGLCRDNHIGYIDQSGNCLISVDDLYISDTGHKNLFPKLDHAKNIFRSSSVVTSKILRVVLRDVSEKWKLQYLSKEAGCSIGMVARVKEYLCEERWAEMEKDGLRITDAEGLLRAWSEAYAIDVDRIVDAYSLDPVPVIEEKISKIIKKKGCEGCLTGFSGGVRYAPVVRYTKIHLWLKREYVSDIMEQAGLKSVESGSNTVIYIADTDDIFLDSREAGGCRIASPVQTYLDCMRLKGRGEEMAEAVLEKEILK